MYVCVCAKLPLVGMGIGEIVIFLIVLKDDFVPIFILRPIFLNSGLCVVSKTLCVGLHRSYNIYNLLLEKRILPFSTHVNQSEV